MFGENFLGGNFQKCPIYTPVQILIHCLRSLRPSMNVFTLQCLTDATLRKKNKNKDKTKENKETENIQIDRKTVKQREQQLTYIRMRLLG